MRRPLLVSLAALALCALAAPAAQAAPTPSGFDLEGFEVTYTAKGAGLGGEGGPVETRAGAHPFAMTTSFGVPGHSVHVEGHEEGFVLDEATRDVLATQIEGLAGEPAAVGRCSRVDFLTSFTNSEGKGVPNCPDSSALGYIATTVANETRTPVPVYSAIYNLVPPPGEVAELGFWSSEVPVQIDIGLSESPPYRVLAGSRNISQLVEVVGAKIVVWGVPADEAHDPLRGHCLRVASLSGQPESSGACHFNGPEVPFLTMPRACRGALGTAYAADSWEHPGPYLPSGEPDLSAPAWAHEEVGLGEDPQGMAACSKLGFAPEIAAAATTEAASAASGLDFSLDVADEGLANHSYEAIADSDIEKTVVTLPKGMTLNPSEAEGLVGCSEAELARESSGSAFGAGCPAASKVGEIEVETPLLPDTVLRGQLYVAEPYANPFGSLIAVYVVISDPGLGIFVKQPLEVEPDPATGQLVSTAEGMPQLPFSAFRLHFREGARAPLITPPGCGTHTTTAQLYPYSGAPPAQASASFEISSGPGGGPCPSGAPFHPGFQAGTLNNQAASYSPFVMRLTRADGEQDMGRFSFVLPPGVVPKLAGIPYCPEAGIARAASRQGPHGGAEELADPSCPAASAIGRTLAGAGVGNQLTYVPGKLYLAGPYHGDPISAVSITPAVAGPFDAGVVVVREALRLNPVIHVGEVDGAASDPIPHILKGIPLNVRDLRVYADRPEFTLNATSCEPFAASSTIWGDGTALQPLGQTPVGLASRYQAANCAGLAFKPKLAVKLKGGTARGKFPALKAVLTPRPGDANLSRAVVTLPHSAFLEQGHFRTICTRVQFAASGGDGAGCPAASQYGFARAFTPLLASPLQGPVYLRSSSHNLPDLVLALHGLVNIDLAARIDSIAGGIRSTFTDVPDAPVSRFILEMQGGQKGLIVNSTNLCAAKHRAKAGLGGQNGRLDRIEPQVRALGCARKNRRRHGRHRGRH